MWDAEGRRPGPQTAEPEVVPPLVEGVPELQQADADAAPVVPAERLLPDLLLRVVGETPVVVEGGDEFISHRAGVPLGGVAIYMWHPVRWGTSVPHWHSSAASRWRRASRLPSATRSPSQLSISWRSAAARSVGSIRSKGPRMSPSRDRASSYTGPQVLNCTTVSRAAPPSRGSHRMTAALRPHVCISVAWSTLAVWRTMRGGMGARMNEDTSPLHPACGSGAACSHSFAVASQGWLGRAPRIMVGRGRVCGAHPSSGMAVYCCAGVYGACMAAHHRPHSRAHSSPTIRASHAVMVPRPMIHRGKTASCRCLEKPPGGSQYGWGSPCGGHSRLPFTTGRDATKSLPRRGGGGGAAALCRGEPSVHPGRCA